MARSFSELRERLLRAGVGPRHVRRYLAELADHVADLTAEGEGAGLSPADARSAAIVRLGGVDDLANAMIGQPQLRSWCARAPWAFFTLGPVALLIGAYLLAGLVLSSGWHFFLPGSDSPFVRMKGGLAMYYFALGRLDYFGAPIFIGWLVALIAARQRSPAVWPLAGLILVALIAGGRQVHAFRPPIPGALGHVSMSFTLGPPFYGVPGGLARELQILMLTMTPYLVWRLTRRRPLVSTPAYA